MNYRKIFAAVIASVAFFGGINQAAAAPIPLSIENPALTDYQQSTNAPCIIGNNSCNSGTALITFTPVPNGGNNNPYPLSSPIYDAINIRNIVGDVFFVGIDVNASGGNNTPTETLLSFTMSIDGVVAYTFSTPTLLSKDNPGNGFADAILKQFSLAGLGDLAKIQFTADLSNLTAGDEQFFLIAGDGRIPNANAPEPGTIAILGLGLLGMGIVARRHRKQQS